MKDWSKQLWFHSDLRLSAKIKEPWLKSLLMQSSMSLIWTEGTLTSIWLRYFFFQFRLYLRTNFWLWNPWPKWEFCSAENKKLFKTKNLPELEGINFYLTHIFEFSQKMLTFILLKTSLRRTRKSLI
jgi:hypothetical protein